MENSYILALGSNTDAKNNIDIALQKLESLFGNIKQSRFIETEPININNNSLFLNGVVKFYSSLKPDDVKEKLKNIEKEQGRTKENSQKDIIPIDIDIINVNDIFVHKDSSRDYIQLLISEV